MADIGRRRDPRRHQSRRNVVQEVHADMRAQLEMRRVEARLTRNRNLSENRSETDDGMTIILLP